MKVDLSAGLARVRNNKAMYSRLLGRFIQNDNVEQLKAALDSNDASQVVYFAHTIKGSAVNLGLGELCNLAEVLEQHTKANGVDDIALDMFSSLQKHHSGIKENLDTILKDNGF